LEEVKIIEDKPRDPSKVFFSAWVTIMDQSDKTSERYRLVGPDEIEASKNLISVDSPMSQALLGKSIGEEIIVRTPSGERHLKITNIKY
jgi:transcription elongation factor GreB